MLCSYCLYRDDCPGLRVCKSAAGYYIGVSLPEEGPICRASMEYWRTREAAEKALEEETWHGRPNP